MTTSATSSGTTTNTDTWISTKNQIHERTWVCLDDLEELRLSLSELLHELLIECGVLKDALSDQIEVRV